VSEHDGEGSSDVDVQSGEAAAALTRARQARQATADAARTAIRRELLAWGIAMALAVPVTWAFTRLSPADSLLPPLVAASTYVLLSFAVAAALRRRVRVNLRRKHWARSDGRVALGGGIGYFILALTISQGARHPVVYPIGMLAILAVWTVVALWVSRRTS
jgi:hypothetical protein